MCEEGFVQIHIVFFVVALDHTTHTHTYTHAHTPLSLSLSVGRTPWTSDRPVERASIYTTYKEEKRQILTPAAGFFSSLILSLYFIRTCFFVWIFLALPLCPDRETHTTQTFMPPAGFEPAFPAIMRPQTCALDRTANRISHIQLLISS